MNNSIAEAPNVVINESNIDFHFDIDASLESINTEPNLVVANLGDSDLIGCTEDDQNALRRCSGLRRKTQNPSDLRPVSTRLLEYSYRWPIVQQDQFWAGPSYWKIPTTKNTSKR